MKNPFTWIKRLLNRGDREEISPKLIEVMQLDGSKSYIALFKLENDNLGYAHLIKGINRKFNMEYSGSGSNGYFMKK